MQNYVRLDKQGTPTDRPTDHRTFALLDLTAPKIAAGKNEKDTWSQPCNL